MAIKFQYNKTSLQQLRKELKVRVNALPTLVAKETALRLEVKKARDAAAALEKDYAARLASHSGFERLWGEMPEGLVRLEKAEVVIRKLAGVKVPSLERLEIAVAPFGALSAPAWLSAGVEVLRSLAELRAKIELAKKKVEILEHARKKTTQKVNLYEKVQIPEYNDSILRIKRFMEDEENLAKSSQKILKTRLDAMAREGAA